MSEVNEIYGKSRPLLRLKFRIVDVQERTLLVTNKVQEEAEYAQQILRKWQ